MHDFLASMAQDSARRTASAKQREPEDVLRRRALESAEPPKLVLHPSAFDVFAEIKRRAPSTGGLVDASVTDRGFVRRQADAYARGGAAAVSVLTEPTAFSGSLFDLSEAAGAVPIPVLRKDFLVEPYQVFEARVAGAGGVLLIARMLDDTRMLELVGAAHEMQLFVLIEAFDADDLARAGAAASACARLGMDALVGLNSRNLVTLAVDHESLRRLRDGFPPDVPRVAESGLSSEQDVRDVAALHYDVALVGSALMRVADPAKCVAQLIAAGRQVKGASWASA